MPLPPITRFSSLATTPSPTNNNNGLYAPPLNTTEIAAIPATTKVNGGIWYNTNTKNLEAVVNNVIQPIQVGQGGQGDVVGPGVSTIGNIAVFNDKTGKLIADSGVDITLTPVPLLRFSNSLEAPNVTVNEIGNLGHVKFTNGLGLIFVDSLMPVEFITNTYKTVTQVCSLFTDGLPSSSTSPSALVEIQSDTGALLLSRMTTTERDALSAPSGANGMLLFNTTSTTFNGFDGTNWRVMPLLNTNGTLTAADPISSANLTTKNYVDTAIAVPAAAKFIVQTANASVPNAQVLGSLTTGLLKNTTTTGVLTTGVAGTDYYSPGNPTRIIDAANNFFIGTNAGNLTLTLSPNTGVGINALAALTNGHSNVAVGYSALVVNTSGTSNSAFGRESLFQNITGSNNSAFGTKSLHTNTVSNNSAFGSNALFSNTTGTPNDAFGSLALFNNTTGAQNAAFGYQSLQSNTIGTQNAAFGHQSLFTNNSGTNNCAFGYKTLFENIIGSGNSGFGYQALGNNIADNNSAFGYQSLFANTTGTQNAAFGTNALTSNTTGAQNAAFGYESLLSNIGGTSNSAFGHQSLFTNNSGTNNCAFGYKTLFENIIGSGNSGFGYQALGNNIADNNSAFGYQSLFANTTGAQNAAFGTNALTSNTTGAQNAAFGYQCLLSNIGGAQNTAFGNQCLVFNTTGSSNSAFGYNSLVNNTTGSFNVALGRGAGSARGLYNNCAFFGYQADASVNNLTNAIAIGYQASVGASNSMVLGGSGANQLSVGIGITPNGQFQLPTTFANRKIILYETVVNDDHQFVGLGVNQNTIFQSLRYQIGSIGGNHIWYAGTSPTTSNELMRLTGGGFLGIGTNAPNAPLHFSDSTEIKKIVLFESVFNSPHQFIGLGTSPSGVFRFQVGATTDNYVWYAATGAVSSNELMRLTGTGFLGIGTSTPNAPLQFANTFISRKIVLYQIANNDHEVYSLGMTSGTFRYQIGNTASNNIWYAATSPTTSNELMRLTGGGFLGLGGVTPNGQLQLPTNFANRKFILYESVVNNDHQFFGLGINGLGSNGALRYQIDNTNSAHIWYAATSSTTSNELMRLIGNGRLGIGTDVPDQLLTVNSSTPSKITAGLWAAFSDARIKDVVGDYEHGLAEIIKIKTRKFKFNDRSGYPEHEKAKINIGIIAQEIEDIFPECIVEKIQKGDIPDMRLYDGTALTYALINAVKELNNEITILKQQINN